MPRAPLRSLLAALLLSGCGTAEGEPQPQASTDGSGDTSSTSAPDLVDSTSGSSEAGTDASDSDGNSSSDSSSEGSSTGEPAVPSIRIGLVQYDADAHFGDWDFNTASLTTWAEAAIAEGASVLVFPEGSSYGYGSPTEIWCAPGMKEYSGFACRDVSTVAETLPGGPTTDYWAAFAAEHQVAVIYHVPEVDGADFYNAIGVVGPNGFVTKYRKRVLYYIDQAYATAGESGVVLQLPVGRFGLMICLDGSYDGEIYDEYLAQGVDGIIIPMDWDDDPNGKAAAIEWFRDRAANNDLRIYAADVSTWDGTGLYRPGDVPRERDGLPEIAIGIDGISVHELAAEL